ncbi:MAG: T9SS type A sorting domain-containing protein, partial [Bacteroidales bacterium]
SNSDGKLKNHLLASSPLSTEALLALLNKRFVPLSYGTLKIVFVANSPLPQVVVKALDELSLPAGIQNVIDDAQYNDPTYLTLDYIKEQISDLISDNQLLQNEKVRQQLKYDDKPAAKEELKQSDLIPSMKALAEELLLKDEVTESRNVINDVMDETLDMEEDEKFAEMMNTMADLKENGKGIHEMEPPEEDVVRQVANSQKIISAKAQVALEFAKSEHYPHPIKKELSDKSLIIPSGENDNYSATDKQLNQFIKLYPNPNNGNMEIEYNVPDDSKCVLAIYNIEGKQIVKYNLNPKNKHTFINDESLFSTGLYYYSLRVNDRIVGKEKQMIIK